MRTHRSRREVLACTGTALAGGLVGVSGAVAQETDVEITVWHGMGGGLGEAFESMTEDFDADGVEVDLGYQGTYRDVLNNTLAAIGTEDFPDVAQIARYETKQVLDSGAFQPVETVLPDDFPVDDLQDALINYFAIDGTLQSMPFNNSNAILYYNRTAFEEAGLDPEQPPETLEEVREYGEAVVDEGLTDYAITWPNHMWFIEHWYALENELLFDNENGREGNPTTIHLDERVGVDVHEWWTELNQDDLFLDPGMEAWGDARDAFVSEQAAIMLNTTAMVRSVVEGAEDQGFEPGTGFHPSLGGRTGTPIGGGSFWVAEGIEEEKAEAIGDYIAHMTQPEQQVFWHQNTGYYPVLESGVEALEEEGWFEENPLFRTAFDQLQNTEPTAATAGAMLGPSHEVRTIVQETSYEVIEGRPVESSLADAREDCERVLQDYIEATEA